MKYLTITFILFFGSCDIKNQQDQSENAQLVTEVEKIEPAATIVESVEINQQEITELIEKFSSNDPFKGRDIPFTIVGISNFSNTQITFHNGEGWGEEPGDFVKIQIGDYKLVNFGGWVKVYERFSDYSPSGYYLELDLGGKSPVIGFIGYPYASDPAYLTLISLGESPELIFNKQVNFKRMEGQQAIVVDGRGDEHKLYFVGDTLKYE